MATDRTEQLIIDLAANMAPVHRLPRISVRVVRWLGLAIAVAALAVGVIGIRRDLGRAMATPEVLWSLGLALVASVGAAAIALRLSVPGADQTRWVRWLPGAVVAVWIVMLVQVARAAGISQSALMREPFHAACVIRVAAIAVLPTLFLVREIRRGVALDAVSAAALAALGGSALAAVAVQLVCQINRPAHVLWSHVAPVVALAVIGAVVAKLGWSSRAISRAA